LTTEPDVLVTAASLHAFITQPTLS